MKLQTASSALALTMALGLAACNSDTPTAPKANAPQTGQLDKQGPNARGQSLDFAVQGPLSRAGEVVGNFTGTFHVTKFGFDQATRQLMVTGLLSGTETFVDGTTAPIADQEVTTTATLKKGSQVSSSTSTPYQFASSSMYQFTASCGILLLDLGPLHLDLLGLVVDLNEVVLDITGQTGAGNLLGNLLCALTGLLDIPGAIAGIINLIDSINQLLGSIGGLATPTVAPLPFDMAHGAVPILRST
ncbi:MAG TPA: hypothetical protein VF105_14305 [Gemmatimonadaceae bacterium]